MECLDSFSHVLAYKEDLPHMQARRGQTTLSYELPLIVWTMSAQAITVSSNKMNNLQARKLTVPKWVVLY